MAERTRLGDTLEKLIQDQRVSIAHIVKYGEISRNTIWLIQQGVTTTPEPETLRKIARGLATDPHSAQFDRPVYITCLRTLCEGAGMRDLTADIPPCDLETEIRAVVGNRDDASALTLFVRRFPNMTAGERKLVNSVLGTLDTGK